MRKLAFLGLSSIAAALYLAPTRAQEPPPAGKTAKASAYTSTVGEVTAIDSAAGKVTIKTNAGASVDVPTDAKTHFLKIAPGETDLKKATESQAGELKVGDRVSARNRKAEDGTLSAATTVLVMTKEELAKHSEKTQQEWKENGLMGTVTVVNPASKEVTIKLIGADAKQVVIEPSEKVSVRRYADDSVKFADAKPSKVEEIKTGDTLRVLGAKNEDGSRVKPEEIVYGTFLRKAGTITAIDAASNTITMKDLATKKPVVVKLNADSVLKKLPEQMAQMLARMQNGGGRGAGAGAGAGEGRGGPPAGAPPGGLPGGPPGGMGGGRGFGGGRMDPSRVLERAPAITVADLKIGDAIMISTSSSSDPSKVTAMTLVAGMEPLLAAPATGRGGQQDPLSGNWGFDIGIPQ